MLIRACDWCIAAPQIRRGNNAELEKAIASAQSSGRAWLEQHPVKMTWKGAAENLLDPALACCALAAPCMYAHALVLTALHVEVCASALVVAERAALAQQAWAAWGRWRLRRESGGHRRPTLDFVRCQVSACAGLALRMSGCSLN